MGKGIKEFWRYYCLEKIPLLKIGNVIHQCKNNAERVEIKCEWKFKLPTKVKIVIFFAVEFCIYEIISTLIHSLADLFAVDICKTAEISHMFLPVIRLITTFYVDKIVCECLDDLA